ncbi:UBA/TS-N domain-containing protein [Cryptosporidium muris RN66]|uniref:UBA/TS-N domain-containing protein n=1 Tax=Cryptosporidium muris (strain RN66) TaxID=441375 RepID=B6ACA2_CRYMR|nr:UBA/TS-N domain-containing protein [Cryptosporidium muris RN66]EEA06158.1 UBA/TS-N domain-containing protein [Cryptosporidium muris RN66]|eukprot:XP_002140507.1 UBA/TS-N domain-containing protein [Cryptosporidium muris RN66]
MENSGYSGDENSNSCTDNSNESNNDEKPDLDLLIEINVKLLEGSIIKLPNKININNTTVLQLKQMISSTCNIPINEIRLVWREKILSDNMAFLKIYKLENDCTIIVARTPRRDVSTNHTSSIINQNNGYSSTSTTSSSSILGNAIPQSTPDDFLTSAMNSPWIQNLLSDPEIFRMILDSNPQISLLREQNPELNHIFNDPQFLQMSIDALRNPELMKEVMRNSDRAMSNIESIPGGFSALKRMYQTVQEPMWDAALSDIQDNKKSYNKPIQYNIDKSLGPNVEALPNPWCRNQNNNLRNSLSQLTYNNLSSSHNIFNNFNLPFIMNNNNNAETQSDPLVNHNPQNNQNQISNTTNNIDIFSSIMRQRNDNNLSQQMQNIVDSMRNMGITNNTQISSNMQSNIDISNHSINNLDLDINNNQQNQTNNYSYQLETLRNMGFTDTDACLKALTESDGSINRAIDKLLNPTQD